MGAVVLAEDEADVEQFDCVQEPPVEEGDLPLRRHPLADTLQHHQHYLLQLVPVCYLRTPHLSILRKDQVGLTGEDLQTTFQTGPQSKHWEFLLLLLLLALHILQVLLALHYLEEVLVRKVEEDSQLSDEGAAGIAMHIRGGIG